ncbi:F-box/LRR-repeat protein 15-like [Camellia sinensis]|uniref:F-box/LRR-repeat protein 15-like n=1 Tax=Camellia sinensis TaxID=4442 RepID=UPI00103661CE|nr:F-box/LRR-repeat protein 15-like [Camellia sinensis]XP_028113894.1 F-box/LRR-repeat protein 15-like [Camellia sinensis]
MAHAVLNCPLLHDLDIASSHKFSNAAIHSAPTSCPLLEFLDMSNCSCVNDETLREIALTCGNLHVLNASNCPNISLKSVRLPMLIVLKLHSCEGITSASMAAISHSYMLEVLELAIAVYWRRCPWISHACRI